MITGIDDGNKTSPSDRELGPRPVFVNAQKLQDAEIKTTDAAFVLPTAPIEDEQRRFRTEVCSMELLFSEYIGTLIPIAESFDRADPLTSEEIDQVIFLVRALREWVVNQLTASFHIFPNNDPFFGLQRMPQLIPVNRRDFNTVSAISIGEYLSRLVGRHRGFVYDDILMSLSPRLFLVGLSNDPADAGKHFLILPDQKELLLAAKEGVLFPHLSASY